MLPDYYWSKKLSIISVRYEPIRLSFSRAMNIWLDTSFFFQYQSRLFYHLYLKPTCSIYFLPDIYAHKYTYMHTLL